jgi:hypothetical protein
MKGRQFNMRMTNATWRKLQRIAVVMGVKLGRPVTTSEAVRKLIDDHKGTR